jgi:hypothetical protein
VEANRVFARDNRTVARNPRNNVRHPLLRAHADLAQWIAAQEQHIF